MAYSLQIYQRLAVQRRVCLIDVRMEKGMRRDSEARSDSHVPLSHMETVSHTTLTNTVTWSTKLCLVLPG